MGMKIISGQVAKNVCVYVCLGVVDFHHEWIATPIRYAFAPQPCH